MRQQTFAEGTFELHTKTTRRAAFLAEMEQPAYAITKGIAPHAPHQFPVQCATLIAYLISICIG